MDLNILQCLDPLAHKGHAETRAPQVLKESQEKASKEQKAPPEKMVQHTFRSMVSRLVGQGMETRT